MAPNPKTPTSDLGFDKYTLNPVDLAETPDRLGAKGRWLVGLLLGVILIAVGALLWRTVFISVPPTMSRDPETRRLATEFLVSLTSENPATAKFLEHAEFARANRVRLIFVRQVWDDQVGGYREFTEQELREVLSHSMQAFAAYAPNRRLSIVAEQGILKLGEAEYFPETGITNIVTPQMEAEAAQQFGEHGDEGGARPGGR